MKVGGQILWNVTPICEMLQISYLMGRRPMKDVLGNHLKDLLFLLVHLLSITYNCERSVPNPSIWKESFTRIVGYALYAGEILKGDILVADLEELETMDASEIYSKRLNAKEIIFPKENGNLFFQSQMDESNFLEEIRTWEHPPRFGIVQFEEKVTLIFLENQEGLFHHLTTHFRMPVKPWTTFGPCREASYTAITLNPESNFTRREKNHSLFHWNTLT